MVTNCLSSRTVKSYLRGESSEVDVETIESHVATCKSCQQLLEEIAENCDSDMPWFAHAQAEKVQVGANSLGSRSFHRTGERLAQPPSSGIENGVSKTMDTIRDYKIIERIGQGGMGTVYRALHLRLNKLVAVKILKSDRLESLEANSRFTREMRLLAQLEHPQIVRALDAGEFDGQQYFVMEFVPGIDLGQLIRRLGPIPVVEACEVIRQAAGALHYAHDRKILHRDVKPSNLMITADGNIKLLDLGLAQLLDKEEGSVTEAGQAVGTFVYMAPETLYGNGTASPQSDVYSLGVTLFQMLSGMRPFERPGMPVLIPDLTSMRPDVLPGLNALVYRMISKDPLDRPRSMQEVERLFKQFAGDGDLPSLVAEYYRWGNRTGQKELSRQVGPIPPPVQSNLMRPQPKIAWPKRIAAAAVTPMIAAMIGYGVYQWSDRPQQYKSAPADNGHAQVEPVASEPIEPTTGMLKVTPHGDVASQFLDEGRIYLIQAETNERFTLDKNELQLPLGKYSLDFDSPVALSEKGQVVEVFPSTTNQLNVRATLTSQFQFPTLPTFPGAYASYYGSIWREGWEKEPNQYELSLEMLPDSNTVGMKRTRWIKLVANLLNDDYCETAYLQIDESRWLIDHRIEIIEGFVQVEGRSITDYRESFLKDSKKDALVLRLVAETDLIAKIPGLVLPEKRISTQDFITLFFGANNVTAAAAQILTLRNRLAQPGGRNAWLDDINNGLGPVSCYVVSSRAKTDDPKSPGYSVARCDDELFGFVELEVNTPSLFATCILKSQSRQPLEDSFPERFAVERLRADVVEPADLPIISPPSEPSVHSTEFFDFAMMPDDPSWVVWSGYINRGNREESLEIKASMLWKGEVDGRECRWLELSVESTLDGRVHWEGTRLLVDSNAYDSRREFKVIEGWIAFDEPGNIFLFPSNGDVDSLIDERLQRQIDTSFDQVGIVDVLTMVFGADLKPKSAIGTLRPKLAGILSGVERKPVAETRNTKLGRPITGESWTPSLGLIDPPYQIFRSADVPFGFVTVKLKIPLFIDIGLETQRCGPNDEANDSLFGSDKDLGTAVLNNRKRIAANALTNWRVWSWTHKHVDYKVWAEYAGEIDAGGTADYPKFVLLADAADKTIRVPFSALSATDRTDADQGRMWASGPKNRRHKLIQDNIVAGTVLTNLTPIPYQFASMVESDKIWVLRLRNLKRSPETLAKAEADWNDFATYSRP